MKVEYIKELLDNAALEESLEKVRRAADWAIYRKGMPEPFVRLMIEQTAYLISQRYSKNNFVQVTPGDIVRIHYGQNLCGEVSGMNTRAVICNVHPTGNVVYAVPIVSHLQEARIYMTFDPKKDLEMPPSEDIINGYLILEKGRDLYTGRINEKIGTLKREYFSEVLRKLPMAFDFTQT